MTKSANFEQLQNEKLIGMIQDAIHAAGGAISFAHFMQLALYAPGLGYYSAGAQKFGRQGDFVTAPEISPLFAQCFAQQFQVILQSLQGGSILEFGAGSGAFARDVLFALDALQALPEHYFILEVSAELRDRQLQHFKAECPQFLSKIQWINTLPTQPFKGIIFANEVLDAMPVHRFKLNQGVPTELCVSVENEQFVWRDQSLSAELRERIHCIQEICDLPDGYVSEMSIMQSAWIHSVSDILQEGVIFLVDYGYGRREYYHPERQDGTLMCFHQHHQHTDPFQFIGSQDVTAHVDFTLLAESADAAGLQVAGFTSQAAFLLACGLLERVKAADAVTNYKNNQAVKTLTFPGQMGEVMKVMALTRRFSTPLLGFTLQDRRRDL